MRDFELCTGTGGIIRAAVQHTFAYVPHMIEPPREWHQFRHPKLLSSISISKEIQNGSARIINQRSAIASLSPRAPPTDGLYVESTTVTSNRNCNLCNGLFSIWIFMSSILLGFYLFSVESLRRRARLRLHVAYVSRERESYDHVCTSRDGTKVLKVRNSFTR